MIQADVERNIQYCLEATNPSFLSSDIFTPDSLPRNTQPSIGQHLVKCKKDTTLGTHYTEYGGIGDRDFLGEKRVNEPSWPRSHRHFISGVKERFLNVKRVKSQTLECWLQQNKAGWVDPPGKNANFLFEIFQKYNTTTKADDQQRSKFCIFPRAKQFELDYIIAQERAGRLPMNKKIDYFQTCDRLICGKPQDQLGTRSKGTSIIPVWWLQAPFWWYGQSYGERGSVGQPNDYGYTQYTHFDKDPPNLREDIEVERPERYIPGQIHTKGPLDTRQPCQCPAVQVDDKNRYPVYRGPGHWPASAMEERRRYANRGPVAEEDKTCALYTQSREDDETFQTSMTGRGQEPCPYYAPPSYETGKRKNPCTCKKPEPRTSVKPMEYNNQASVEKELCPVHSHKVDVSCPFEPGRPCPASGGILSGAACFDSPEQQRKFQLHKLGTPFRTEACQWYNKNFPFENFPPVERPQKKTFPEMRFSNL